MIVGRIVGWLLLIAAIAIAARDLLGWYDTGHYQAIALGELWFQIDRNSLLLLQPAIQRHIAVWPWDWVIAPLLQIPAALAIALPGLLLLWLFRRRKRRR